MAACSTVLVLTFACLTPSVVSADQSSDLMAAYQEAAALNEKGEYRGAAKAYERAVELARQVFGEKHSDTVKLTNNLAALYRATGEYQKAEKLFSQTLKIKESQLGPNHLDLAVSLNNLAVIYWEMGQPANAVPLLQRALKIQESQLGPNHTDVALSLNNLASLYQAIGEYDELEPLYLRSLQIWESNSTPNDANVALGLNNLAALYRSRAQYGKAEPLYQRSLKIYESRFGAEHPEVAMALDNLGALYDDMGQFSKAEPLYQASLKIRETKLGPDHSDVARSINNLAELYRRLGENAKAEPLFRRSLRIFEATFGPDHHSVATVLNNLAALSDDMGKVAEAESFYQRSLAAFESKRGPNDPAVARGLNNLAMFYADTGHGEKAEALYRRSLNIYEAKFGPSHPDVAMVLNNLACLYASAERWTDALSAAERQRRISRRHVVAVLPALSDKEQLAFLKVADRHRLENALSLGLERRADARMAEHSAEWVLNGKAVAQESLAQRAVLASEEANPSLAEVAKELSDVRRRLASLTFASPPSGQESAHRAKIDGLYQEEQELSRRLGQRLGRTELGDPWVELSTVRAALPKDAALIEIARFRLFDFKATGKGKKGLPPRYVAWLIPAADKGPIEIIDLGDAQEIEDSIKAARKLLEGAETGIPKNGEAEEEKRLQDVMRKLAERIWEPIRMRSAQASRFIISPDAALWLVPWGALPTSDGKYAVEKYSFSYCVSGRDLVNRAAADAKEPTAPILFADPDYDLDPRQRDVATRAVLGKATSARQAGVEREQSSLGRIPRVQRLPGTAAEAAAIRPSLTLFAKGEPTLYAGQFALESVFKVVHRPKVLVLSTHGFFLAQQDAQRRDEKAGERGESAAGRAVLSADGDAMQNPLLRCGLLLAGCNRRGAKEDASEDGILSGMEIVGVDLRGTELVVLSACDTGLGELPNGEGVAGLRQAFQMAGAGAVAATLWQIPDQETADLMNAFFTNLADGQSKADALQNAQRTMIQNRRRMKSAAHPYYWAAFTLTGMPKDN